MLAFAGTQRHGATVLAWSLCALSIVLTGLSLYLLRLNLSYPGTHVYAPWLDNTLSALSYAPVGALIAWRRPANPIGWLLVLYGLAISVSHFGAQYAIYTLIARVDSLPAGQMLTWVVSWLLPVMLGIQLFVLLLFPTGRLPSRRWSWVAWSNIPLVSTGAILGALSPGSPMGVLGPIQNTLGEEGLPDAYYEAFLYFVFPALSVVAFMSLFARFRRATGVERQQIKWFVYAAAASIVGTVLGYVVPGLLDTPAWFERLGFVVNLAFIPAIPVAIGIAVLRYRLFDIDLLINRTLVYGSLTATLFAVYFGGIVLLQELFVVFAGREKLPQLVVVASTLAIAALFNPLRRRIQSVVDRRFYRSKFDARQTLEDFSARLRDETDLDGLREDLMGAVRETMQPAHASVWLRASDGHRRGQALR